MIREWENGEAAFQYEIRNGEVRVLAWKGSGNRVVIPQFVEGLLVTAVGRKAFLSNKRILEVYLPESIREVEEWAFAYCSRLKLLSLPDKNIKFGKGAFLQCSGLEHMRTPKLSHEMSGLLAAVVCKLDAPYLLSIQEAGTQEWLEKWDARMLHLMTAPDKEGYAKTILCGEEDYGSMDNNLDYFLSEKRKSKVRLALVRLLYSEGLSGEMRAYLENYLRTHTKGCASEESWLVVKEEYRAQRSYCELLYQAGALTQENYDAVLHDMGSTLAEEKAYLLQKREEWFAQEDVFAGFML